MRSLTTCALALFVGIVGATDATALPQPQNPVNPTAEPYTAVVRSSDAWVVFPKSAQSEWEWCLHHGPTQGTFDLLLKSGQRSVGLMRPGHTSLTQGKVDVIATADRLFVVIKDPKTLALLFSQRPLNITLRTQLPGQSAVTRDVGINYVP